MGQTETADPIQDQLDTLALERREVERRRHNAQGEVISCNERLRQIAVEDRALRGAAR